MSPRRVVVTGIGALTSLGNDAPSTFAALLEKRSGAGPITRWDAKDHVTKFACEIKGFDPSTVLEPHEARKLDPFTLYAMAAAQEAVRDCGIALDAEDRTRIGCIVGVGIGGLTDIEGQHSVLMERGPRRVNPFFIPKIMMNAAAGEISIPHGLQGANYPTAPPLPPPPPPLGLATKAIPWE